MWYGRLRRGAAPSFDRQRRQESRRLGGPHLGWVALAVKQDVAAEPPYIRLLGPVAVVPDPERLADGVEKPQSLRRRRTAFTYPPMATPRDR